jgi:hypothetical protein
MARTILPFLFCILQGSILLGQQNQRYLEMADSTYYYAKDYKTAAMYYDSLFAGTNKVGGNNYYNAACTYALAGQKDKSLNCLRTAIERKGVTFHEMYYDKELESIRDLPEYKNIESRYRTSDVLFINDILDLLKSNNNVHISNKKISLAPEYQEYTLSDLNSRWLLEDSVLDFSSKDLRIHECEFLNAGPTVLVLPKLNSLTISDSKKDHGSLDLIQSNFKDLVIVDNSVEELSLSDVAVDGIFQMFGNSIEFLTFDQVDIRFGYRKGAKQRGWTNRKDQSIIGLYFFEETETLRISNSSFSYLDGQADSLIFQVSGAFKNLFIYNTDFQSRLKLVGSTTNGLDISECDFSGLFDFTGFTFPEFNLYIPFEQFDSKIARFWQVEDGSFIVLTDSIPKNVRSKYYDNLIYSIKYLYNNYRTRGELTSANASYKMIKELEIERLSQKENRTREESIRLWLNKIMGFYTDHGTSPGKAIIISFYLIIGFSLFYFFFPSEWDKESKNKLVKDFQTFMQKNDDGYLTPFLHVIGGFLLSFVNAFALSINAFVTLGFGTIPTQGLARYVCILQGSLGWFLLSLFTVALINQVLL